MRRWVLALCAVAFLVGLAGGFALPYASPEASRALYDLLRRLVTSRLGVELKPSLQLALLIFLNNARVALLTLALGVTVVMPVVVVAGNGALLGLVASIALLDGRHPLLLAAAVLPHGVVEVPALVYAASVSVELGLTVWGRLLGGAEGFRSAAVGLLRRLAVALALFLVAALIEGLVTPIAVSAVQNLLPP